MLLSETIVEEVVLMTVVDVVDGPVLVDVVTPVPTTCLFGMMPCGISSALILAKPSPNVKKVSSMVTALRNSPRE